MASPKAVEVSGASSGCRAYHVDPRVQPRQAGGHKVHGRCIVSLSALALFTRLRGIRRGRKAVAGLRAKGVVAWWFSVGLLH